MKILDYLSAGSVKIPLPCHEKNAAIEQLVELLFAEKKIPDKQPVAEAILKREQSISTAIGEGVAIPHAKVEGIFEPCIAVGICPEGIACETPDSKPVKIIFVIVSSLKDAGAQLKILAALARHIKTPGFVSQLESALTPQDVLNVFGKLEEMVRL